MKHVGNLDVKGVVLASTASISSMNAIQGISVAGASQKTGTVVFSNANSVTFGMVGSTITGSVLGGGNAVSMYPYTALPGMTSLLMNSGTTAATGGSTQETMRFHVWPMTFPMPVVFKSVYGAAVYESTNNATGNVTERYQYGLYTRSGNTLNLESSWVCRVTNSQNSSTAMTMATWWGDVSTDNSTLTQGNVGVNMYDVNFLLLVGTTAGATITGGEHYGVCAFMKTSANAVVAGLSFGLGLHGSQTNVLRSHVGDGTGAPMFGPVWGFGSLSANGTNSENVSLPASIGIADITITNIGQNRQMFMLFKG